MYFQYAVDVIQAHAYAVRSQQWNASTFRRRGGPETGANARPASATPPLKVQFDQTNRNDVYRQIRAMLHELDDDGALFVEPSQVRRWFDQQQGTTPQEIPPFRVDKLSGNIASVCLSAPPSVSSVSKTEYARHLRAAITMMHWQRPSGWVIDVRSCSGGCPWPALGGLGSLLGAEVFGAYTDSAGRMEPWWYDKEKVGFHRTVRINMGPPPYKSGEVDERAPIAVLTGPFTAGAGEAVAVSFHGRAGTRSFGGKTWGRTGRQTSFALPDGALIVVTTHRFVDRTGTVYADGYVPNQSVEGGDVPPDDCQDDVVMAQALGWLRERQLA